MTAPIAAAGILEGAAVVVAAALGAAVLTLPDARRRSLAMAAALVAAVAAVATIAADEVTDRAGLAGAAAALGLVVVAALSLLFAARPRAFPLIAIGVLPFRVPVPIGEETVNLLAPLYAVIAAGCVAYLVRHLRGAPEVAADVDDEGARRSLRRLGAALAVVLGLYALQSLYSTDAEKAVRNVAFFYVPFAVLYALLVEVRWTRSMLVWALGLVAGLAVLFAGVGFVEYATGHLVVHNPKVLEANELKPYFRVNSLFFDPNIYGRFLAIAMIALASVLLWSRRGRDTALIGATLGVLWVGLLLSLSQSSFASLLLGLAVLAVLRWRTWVVVAVAGTAVAAFAVVALASPGVVGVKNRSWKALDRATSGRAGLVEGAAKMVRDRPLHGFGSGSFAERYRARERVFWQRLAAESHTIPLTVAAEQGLIGLIAYLAAIAAAFALVFGGVRARLRRGPPDAGAVARMAVAAAFCALFLHTLVYAAFLEDPMTWLLLALPAALRTAPEP